jgi:lipoprotein-anchoring transpeptidase ErfK/SrfK
LRAYQRQVGLPPTGALDASMRQRLLVSLPALTAYPVSANDLARLLPVSATWLGKSRQPRLDFASVLELVAEGARSHPGLIRQLNPHINWSLITNGTTVTVPNITPPSDATKAASVRIHLAGKNLEAFDREGKLVAHFPCSIARLVEKRPTGTLEVIGVVHQPNYTFNPAVFPESAEGRRLGHKLVLPPGPNNPVGTAWIGLDLPGYGIHGTPHPEQIGRTESHGCFRFANWDAEFLARIIRVGTPVFVEP